MTIQLNNTQLPVRNLHINGCFFIVHLSVVQHLLCNIFSCKEFSTQIELADPFITASVDVLAMMNRCTQFPDCLLIYDRMATYE